MMERDFDRRGFKMKNFFKSLFRKIFRQAKNEQYKENDIEQVSPELKRIREILKGYENNDYFHNLHPSVQHSWLVSQIMLERAGIKFDEKNRRLNTFEDKETILDPPVF